MISMFHSGVMMKSKTYSSTLSISGNGHSRIFFPFKKIPGQTRVRLGGALGHVLFFLYPSVE